MGIASRGILASKLPPAKLLRHPAAASIVASDDPLATSDRDAQAWFHAGELEYQLGRQDEADTAFARALEIRPGYGRPRQFLNRPRLEK
jgi:tetratricopeptide (TPR) repeat protein